MIAAGTCVQPSHPSAARSSTVSESIHSTNATEASRPTMRSGAAARRNRFCSSSPMRSCHTAMAVRLDTFSKAMNSGSATMSRTRRRGFSDEIGSW